MNDFALPAEANEIEDAMNQGVVNLPFEAPYLWWMNGKRANQQLGGVQYFGGWATDADTLEGIANSTGSEIPNNWIRLESVANDGSVFSNYSTRYLAVATIGRRKRWITSDYGGNRSHLQILCYLANYNKDEKQYEPWGPIVLTAKGLAGAAVEQAITDWGRGTAIARTQLADGIKPWFFYVPLGTFQGEPIFQTVGKGNNTSTITPCQTFIPDQDPTKETLHRWFVGETVASIMVDLKRQADSWLTAWDNEDSSNGKSRNEYANAGTTNLEQNLNNEIPF